MAYKTRSFTVTTTPQRIDTAEETDSVSGSSIAFYVESGSTVRSGGADVTATGATRGTPTPVGTWSSGVDLDPGEQRWAVVESGTADITIEEQGV